MTETESAQPEPTRRASALAAGQSAGDPLAAALLRAQRLLCEADVEPDVRLRLYLRYTAICTSLKVPAANRARGAERLKRLIADVTGASRGQGGRGDELRRERFGRRRDLSGIERAA